MTKIFLQRLTLGLSLLMTFALTACGGGGGEPEPNYRLTFSPATLSASLTEGQSQALTVTVTFDRAVPAQVNVLLMDTVGVMSSQVNLSAASATSYIANLSTAPALKVGRHSGNLQVRLCLDAPLACNSPLPGSPFLLPYDFNVTAVPVKPAGAFDVPALTVNAYMDEVPAIRVSATFNAATGAAGAVYPQIVGPVGVFQANPPSVVTDSGISSTLALEPSLVAGTHKGNLELRVCTDLACKQQVAGSPVMLPYTLDLRATTNLTPIVRWPGVGEWAGHQANAAHTGYVPVKLDATKFNRRWRWTPPDASGEVAIQPLATSNGSVFAVTTGYFQTSALRVLAESDKSTAWQREFGTVYTVNPPATADGQVFLATSGHSDTFMWGFNATNGALQFRTAFDSQWERYLAPTIANGAVYTDGGSYGGMLSFRISDGTQNWFTGLDQYDQWTPAVDGKYAYAFLPSGLSALDVATGNKAFTIVDPSNTIQPYSVHGAPMITSPDNLVVVNGPASNGAVNRLVKFDLAQRQMKWSWPGAFRHAPASAGGVVYVVNGTQLEARSGADGSRLWGWVPDEATTDPFPAIYGQEQPNIIATDNLVFVCTSTRVYAIESATQKVAWSYPARATSLALSPMGILYITTASASAGGPSIIAINLR